MKQQITGEIFSIQSMMDDLHKLGLRAGMHVIVHTSYKSLGHVIGGPSAVVLALENMITPEGTIVMPTFSMRINGARTWTYYDDIENDCGDFPDVLRDYRKTNGPLSQGKVGKGDCLLVPQTQLVDYGVEWMIQNRK